MPLFGHEYTVCMQPAWALARILPALKGIAQGRLSHKRRGGACSPCHSSTCAAARQVCLASGSVPADVDGRAAHNVGRGGLFDAVRLPLLLPAPLHGQAAQQDCLYRHACAYAHVSTSPPWATFQDGFPYMHPPTLLQCVARSGISPRWSPRRPCHRCSQRGTGPPAWTRSCGQPEQAALSICGSSAQRSASASLDQPCHRAPTHDAISCVLPVTRIVANYCLQACAACALSSQPCQGYVGACPSMSTVLRTCSGCLWWRGTRSHRCS